MKVQVGSKAKERKKKMACKEERWQWNMKVEVGSKVVVKERKKKIECEGERWQWKKMNV